MSYAVRQALEAVGRGGPTGVFPVVELVFRPADDARVESGQYEAERFDELADDEFTAHLAVCLVPDRARQGRVHEDGPLLPLLVLHLAADATNEVRTFELMYDVHGYLFQEARSVQVLLQCDMTAAAITLDLTTRDIRVYALHLMEEAGAPPR